MDSCSHSADAPSFEAALASLEAIVHDLEDGDLGLAAALARYEQGIKHLRHCYDLLEQAERKIEQLTGVDGNGNPKTAPFHEAVASEAVEATPPSRRPAKKNFLQFEDEESDELG